ncbi:MAG TPA: EscN/YscN/HrcN family type III secretion system ATPase [Candidatus Baltobacteraceae bacterium]|nr:EscN/YscN/HrcN family type III secretion system ATPase [Candidatus Baltobacteraceae bacterium]
MNALALGTCAFGRAIDAFGNPIDGAPPLRGRRCSIVSEVPRPNERAAITAPFWTGVRTLDGLLTIGCGARIGVFGAPGTGKSSLLEAVVARCAADAVVIGLIGERGREARNWIDRCDARTTVVCATSDRPACERIAAAHVAIAQARALRDRGLHVVLLLDSLARVAAALREKAVANGESTGRGGYPPSVFADLARLVETAGALHAGSITLVASVLNDGDDRDPVSDAARSLLDGHIALSERLANAGRFPAIDVCASTSRTMPLVVTPQQAAAAARVRGAIALLERIEDARRLGIDPVDPVAVAAIACEPALEGFLQQGNQRADPGQTLDALFALADTLDEPHGHQ